MIKNYIAMSALEEDAKPDDEIRLWMDFEGSYENDLNKDITVGISSINHNVSLTYLIDEISKAVIIDLTNQDPTVKHNNPDNFFYFITNIYNCKPLKDFQFIVTINGIGCIAFYGFLSHCNLITDAEIVSTTEYGPLDSFILDAPNLKELTVNIETSKIMLLSDQTPKDFKLITEGEEGYFYDPYFEYDPCS